MSTSEYKSVDAEGDLPISAAELAALANQLFAASFRPGPDTPPQTTPVAPRGTCPTRRRWRRRGHRRGSRRDPVTHRPRSSSRCRVVIGAPAPTSPGPEPVPPQTVPVAPRGNVRTPPLAPSAGTRAPVRLDPFCCPRRGPDGVRGALGHRADRSGGTGGSGAAASRWRRAVRHRPGPAGRRRLRSPRPRRLAGLRTGGRPGGLTRRTTTSVTRPGATAARARSRRYRTTTRFSTSTRCAPTSRSCARPSTANR